MPLESIGSEKSIWKDLIGLIVIHQIGARQPSTPKGCSEVDKRHVRI